MKVGSPWYVYSFQDLIDELRPLQNGSMNGHNEVTFTSEAELVQPEVCNETELPPVTNGYQEDIPVQA